MNAAVLSGALAVAAVNLITAAIGALLWRGGRLSQPRRARPFWLSLRVGQGCALALAAAVGVLAAAGTYSREHLFYLYALLPLAVAFVGEQLRVTSAQAVLDRNGLPDAKAVGRLALEYQRAIVGAIVQREVAVMALSALVVALLELRAGTTAHF